MELLTGPVVGRVSSSETRILVEPSQDGTLGITFYTIEQTTPQQTISGLIKGIARRPVVFSILGLSPSTIYHYVVTWGTVILAESYVRVPNNDEELSVIVVSCNALYMLRDGDLDLWNSMLQRHFLPNSNSRIDILLHIGDQVYEYIDEVWKRAFRYMCCLQGKKAVSGRFLNSIDASCGAKKRWIDEDIYGSKRVFEEITEMYRELYRKQWNHPPLKTILSRVSNEMILDDHDVRNGWGILEEDRNNETIEFSIGICALTAYKEYQVQLWRDVPDANHRIDYRFLRRKNTGIFIMDVRNPRTVCFNKNSPYVGPEQFQYLAKVLDSSDSLDNLMLVCSIPILLSSPDITDLATNVDITYDIRDHWSQKEYAADHSCLLDMLACWKQTRPTRQLILVGGDIHMALHSVVFDDGKFLCEQVVTSPITNEATTGLTCWCQDLFITSDFSLYRRFHVSHDFKLHKRNYAHIWFSDDKKWNFVIYED